MKLTSALFEAYLKCATKSYLRSTGQVGSGNAYAEWVREQNDAYRKKSVQRLLAAAGGGVAAATPGAENLKTATWRLTVDLPLETDTMASRLHAVERVPSQGRGRPAQFIPVRFVFFNKLTKDDRLLVAFDALVLSEVLRREVSVGKIIHGDDHATLNLKIPALLTKALKLIEKIAALVDGGSAPDLILNRHCAECEFQARCRQKAVEKDDLSLLAGMSAKEREKLRSKGIFTVTQLSYTFRPRRRPRRQRDKREKYHHSLKALAIREKKIHIVGSPELKIEGTPVYLDVEGLPDRDFYYLVGVRIGNGESAVQHSLWADTVEDEGKIWREFLDLLGTVEKPVLIHYGSYETRFFGIMAERYGELSAETGVGRAIKSAVNVVSIIFAQVYFPTYSNGLKEVAGYLGCHWSATDPSGLRALLWRFELERTKEEGWSERLIKYNSDDCRALEYVVKAVSQLGPARPEPADAGIPHAIVHTELLPHQTMWPRFSSPLPEFEQINKAARWDYQRERIYIRGTRRSRRIVDQCKRTRLMQMRINKRVIMPDQPFCPVCGCKGCRHLVVTTSRLYDLFFGRNSLKTWVVEFRFRYHWCSKCRTRFGLPSAFWPRTHFGRNLVAFVVYQVIDLNIPQLTVQRGLTRLLGYRFSAITTATQIHRFKAMAADFYRETQQLILNRIVSGSLVHVDETKANVRGRTAYVWVFATLHEVAYLYSESREGELAQTILSNVKGVLVSDFYAVYDRLECPQQKCLLHLMRDLNAELLHNPFDEELKRIVHGFALLLKDIVSTIDRFGLKKRFLHRHHTGVDRFFRQMSKTNPQSEPALKCKQRFEKNRGTLFTFLDFDRVPWNNNNAEHAIKAFAGLRDIMEGSSTRKGLEEYLVLLSVSQTCKYIGVDFLDFLRSGEKDLHAFAESRVGHRRRQQPIQSANLPLDDGNQK